MWFGTRNGLNRYDGYDVKIFVHDPQDPRSLGDNRIDLVYEDRAGDLWVEPTAADPEAFAGYRPHPTKPFLYKTEELAILPVAPGHILALLAA